MEPTGASFNIFKRAEHGKPSAISAYCQESPRQNDTCKFVCRRQGYQTFAKDIRFCSSEESPSNVLDEQVGWLARVSLFGVIGVRHVKIKIVSDERTKKGFEVIMYSPEPDISGLKDELRQAIDMIEDGGGCGVTISGARHDRGLPCVNTKFDSDLSEFCPVQRARLARLELEGAYFNFAFLNYFWRHRTEPKAIDYLQQHGFVRKYTKLAYDCWLDAEDPYGKTIDGIEMLWGWKAKQLLWTLLIALICDAALVAMTTFVTNDLAKGLAAGSYAVAVEAVPFALLNLLGALFA